MEPRTVEVEGTRAKQDDWDMGPPWVGLMLVVGGGWWLAGELGLVPFEWSYFGPIALIAVGLSMVFGKLRGR